jgi:hypothetical protein
MVLISSGAPDYVFTDIREAAGVRYMETHSNPNLVDVDNDGDLDLFITGVYVGYKSQLYLNRLAETGSLRFELYNYPSGIWVDNGWGSAWADYDNDGDLDLFATELWRNDLAAADNNWIKIEARGRTANHAAIGARITVEAGGKTYVREIQGGSGTTTQDDLVAHVGIGGAAVIDRVTVKFPGGGTASETNVEPNQTLTIIDPEDGDDDTADDDDNPPDDDGDDDDDEGCGC